MAHKIMEFDIQQGRAMAWHNLTKVDPALRLSSPTLFLRQWNPILAGCGLWLPDGKGGKIHLEHSDENGVGNDRDNERRNADEWQCPVVVECAQDSEISMINPLIVGKPFSPESYTFVDNVRFLGMMEASLSAAGIDDAIDSCGSVFNRSRVFLSAPLPSMEKANAGGREFKFFLNAINSFDKSTELLFNVSNTCTVCNNTLTCNLAAGGFSIPHTKNANDRIEAFPEIIALALESQGEFVNEFLKLASEACDERTAEAFFAGFLGGESAEKLSVTSVNRIERLVELFRNGPGNKGETFADLLSAGTDFFTHEAASMRGNPDAMYKNHLSSEFGAGAKAKSRLFEVLTAKPEGKGAVQSLPRKRMITRGRELIKATEAAIA